MSNLNFTPTFSQVLSFVVMRFQDEPSCPSLPDPVSDTDDVPSSGEVSLPDSVGSNQPASKAGPGMINCCKKQCSKNWSTECIEEYRLQFHQKECQDRMKLKFDCLRDVYKANQGHSKQDAPKTLQRQFQGQQCCRKFWEFIHGLSPNKVDSLLKSIRAGATELAPHGPRFQRDKDAWHRIRLELYQRLAEPLSFQVQKIASQKSLGCSTKWWTTPVTLCMALVSTFREVVPKMLPNAT